MAKKDNRSRNWTFVGYPGDSLPENYREIMNDELHLCWCESPVHDADLNGDGSEKKKHIHFVVVFEGNKSYEQIQEITDRLGCPIPQVCRNMRSMIRYLIHADNPDKTQYKREDIVAHGGMNIDEYFGRSQAENRKILMEIVEFCEENNIREFVQLVQAAWALGDTDWIDVITCRNTMFLNAYLKSKKFYDTEMESKKVIADRRRRLESEPEVAIPVGEDKKARNSTKQIIEQNIN